jgi:molecular chaperone GrpE
MAQPKADQTQESEFEQPEAGNEPLAEGRGVDIDSHIDALITERDEMRDRLLRALAETENVRKRAERDRREAESFGSARLARDLLPVWDNLTRAIDSIEQGQRDSSAALIEGIEITRRELLSIFEKHGISRLSPEPGDPFDPQHHQAMFEAPVAHVAAGCVIQVMADGFLLHDRLLRPAQVGVSAGAPAG